MASAGVGIAASDAGMGGFVSSISASLAGTAVNQATQSRPGLGLGSNGTVSYGRNGEDFKAISVEFDQAEFNRVIDGVKAKVFGRALDKKMPVPEAVEAVEQEVEQFVEEVETEQAKAKKTAEMISKNDERLKTEASQADSNKKKAYALVNGIERINKKQAEVAVKTPETPVQEAAQKTELELLATAKQRYFENLQELERQEKVQRADEAVRSRQTLIWSQLDDPNCVDLSNIKIENEGAVRAAAEKNVAKEFRHYRDVVDADFCAQCRFLKGEGYVKVPEVQGQDQQFLVDNDRPNISVSFEQVNNPKKRMERLRQEELSKVGESYVQRVAKMVPLLGSYVDYRYDPEASLGNFGKSLGIEVALFMMPVPGGGTVKAIGKTAKTAATVKKVANTVVKTAGKSEIGAIAKTETTVASQAANDAFLKNVQRNILDGERHFLTGRRRITTGPGKTEPLLRRGEKPSARPTPKQSEIDDTLRLKKAGQIVEPQVSFLNGKRCKWGTPGSIRVDSLVNDQAAHEIKNYNLTSNVSGLIQNIVEQALKHHKHLPEGTRQIFKIDARGQMVTPQLENKIKLQIVTKSNGILSVDDVRIIRK